MNFLIEFVNGFIFAMYILMTIIKQQFFNFVQLQYRNSFKEPQMFSICPCLAFQNKMLLLLIKWKHEINKYDLYIW